MVTTLNELLRHHVSQGHIHLKGGEWEVGIFAPWEPVTNPDWLEELRRMYDADEIVQLPDSSEIVLAA